jgi:dTDP-glucose 4,6-dehydratase
VLGYASRARFADGLTTTVRWNAEHRDWWEPLKRSSAAVGTRLAR